MRARVFVAAVCAGLLAVGRAAPALAQDSVLVSVGNNLSGRAGDYIDVPITVDLSGAPGRFLGSYTAMLTFNPAQLQFVGADNGTFAAPQTNTNHASDSGTVRLTAIQPSGASGAVIIFYARFYVLSDSGQSPVTISFSEMSATATSVTPFESLLVLLRYVQGTFCKSLGRWGDVDGDGQANSFDALVVLSYVVGDSLPPTVNPALGDVDGDGRVTSRDALIILSYAVGLPVTGYRVLLNAPGACGTGAPITIIITPDSLELQVGQTTSVVFAALDSVGHSVSTDSGTVTSSDPSIAGWVNTEGGPVVQARAPGTAIFTARLGPGVAATFKVVVLARRTRWFVDVLRASLAPAQLGDSVLPFEFIGDALNLAHNGDTVLVAGGTYEEEVSADVAVTILGDATNRPVLDPRGSPNWNSYGSALDLEPDAGQIVLANLVLRAGVTYLGAHDITVRNVRIEGLGTNSSTALDLWTAQLNEDAPPARAAGPQRSAVPEEPGNVLVDGVVVLADSAYYGIGVELADTVVIRNSSVTRSLAGTSPYCGVGPSDHGGIVIEQASVSVVQGNVVANPDCQGIAVFDPGYTPLVGDVGRATISGNRVTGAPGTGIAVGTRLVALDHNAVRNTGTAFLYTYGATAGIHVAQYGAAADSITSLADTVLNSGGRGFAVDTAGAASIDSLVVAGTGQDSSSYGSYGVDLEYGGHFALSHSHVSNTFDDNAVNVQGDHSVIVTHGNYIVGSGYNGISAYYYNSECRNSCAPVARAGPERVGPYLYGPDTLISVADTILSAQYDGIYSENGVYTFVNSLVVDATGYDGVEAGDVGSLLVQNSSISRVASVGVDAYSVDHVQVLLSSITAFGVDGIAIDYSVDTARVYGVTVANGNQGIVSVSAGSNMLVDSSAITNNAIGMIFDGGAGARIQRSRIEGNGLGITLFCCSYDSVVVRQSTIQGNTSAGAYNGNTEYGAMLDADSNYWGDPSGPACRPETCGVAGQGDSIQTAGVLVPTWLSVPPVTAAPPFRALASARAGATGLTPRAAPSMTLRRRHASGAMRPGVARAPTAAGAAAVRVAATAAAPRRAPHRQPAAWHAPSKAKSHAVQVLVKKRI